MTEQQPPFADDTIQLAFDAFPSEARAVLLKVRGWIFEIASGNSAIGSVIEELKWGQPSYATRPKTGCPLRLGMPKDGKTCALYVPCQTSLLTDLRAHYDNGAPQSLQFEGNRGIHFNPANPLPEAELRHAIALGLSYYLNKKP